MVRFLLPHFLSTSLVLVEVNIVGFFSVQIYPYAFCLGGGLWYVRLFSRFEVNNGNIITCTLLASVEFKCSIFMHFVLVVCKACFADLK